MGRVAFVFSGQGDQHPGMGRGLFDCYAAARAVFDLCDSIRPGTSGQCFSGTAEELKETKNTQPCMYAVEMAGAAALTDLGLKADMAAGFSLGELAALAYSGATTAETGFRLVCKRGELMQRDAEKQSTAMAAVVRLSDEQVEAVCAQFEGIYPVNYNCPGQITVSGPESEMADFYVAVKQAGGRALPLKVKGAFHSPYMAEAAEAFSAEIAKAELVMPAIPTYSDVTAEQYQTDVGSVLGRQITSPVRWEKIVRNMIDEGVDTFVEIGPGKTLCNLIARIDSAVRTFAIANYEDLNALVQEAKAC